jgi:predicted TIM-barrel fold metal-dependent hydrolase
MNNKTKKSEMNRSRRTFIKSAGLLAGSTVLTGSGFASCPVFTDGKESEIQGNLSGKINLIDIHVHSCMKRLPGVVRASGTKYPTPEELIAKMDSEGITKAVVLSGVSPECKYTIVTSEEDLAICALYPDRLIPFCNFDPRFLTNSPKADFLPLLSAYKEAGCKGIGEYVPNIPLDDPLNMNFFNQVAEVGLPLLFHLAPAIGGYYGCYDEPGLPRLEKVLKQLPKLIILGHSQVFWAEIGSLENPDERKGYPKGLIKKEGRLVELMRKYPNLHGDLSAGSGYNAISRDPEFGYRFMEEFQDRLYFGTDIAYIPQVLPQVAYFRKLKEQKLISETAYEKIAWKNAYELLLR